MNDDLDIPANTKELDNALHDIHSNLIKPKKDEAQANKYCLKKVMCVHMKLSWFLLNLLPYMYCVLLYGH
jgi:hypothetical protein